MDINFEKNAFRQMFKRDATELFYILLKYIRITIYK